jgi:hypothetical protein
MSNVLLRDTIAYMVNMQAEIERAFPQWRAISTDPKWGPWLRVVEAPGGMFARKRQDILEEALQHGNASAVIMLLRRFIEMGGWVPESGPVPVYGGARERTIYSRDAIARHYRDHQRGLYAGREEDWLRRESDIIAASREGRIIGGLAITKNVYDMR